MRGDFVTITMPGDFGKPRPAPVIQANQCSWMLPNENSGLRIKLGLTS